MARYSSSIHFQKTFDIFFFFFNIMNKLCNTSNVYSWSIVIFRYVPFQFSHGRMDVTSSISTIYILFVPSWEGYRYSIRSNTVNAHRCSNLYRLEPLFRNRVRCKYRTAIHTEDSIEKKMPRSLRELIVS